MDFVLVPDPRLDVIGELLEASPSFAPVFGEYLERSGDQRLDYVAVGEFASHVVGLYEHGDLHEFPAVFARIESLYERARDSDQNLLTVGLIEGIQNIALNHGLAPDAFRLYLGPRTQVEWDNVIRFWEDPPVSP